MKLQLSAATKPMLLAIPDSGSVKMAYYKTEAGDVLVSNAGFVPFSPVSGEPLRRQGDKVQVLPRQAFAGLVKVGTCPACTASLRATASLADVIERSGEAFKCITCASDVTPKIDISELLSVTASAYNDEESTGPGTHDEDIKKISPQAKDPIPEQTEEFVNDENDAEGETAAEDSDGDGKTDDKDIDDDNDGIYDWDDDEDDNDEDDEEEPETASKQVIASDDDEEEDDADDVDEETANILRAKRRGRKEIAEDQSDTMEFNDGNEEDVGDEDNGADPDYDETSAIRAFADESYDETAALRAFKIVSEESDESGDDDDTDDDSDINDDEEDDEQSEEAALYEFRASELEKEGLAKRAKFAVKAADSDVQDDAEKQEPTRTDPISKALVTKQQDSAPGDQQEIEDTINEDADDGEAEMAAAKVLRQRVAAMSKVTKPKKIAAVAEDDKVGNDQVENDDSDAVDGNDQVDPDDKAEVAGDRIVDWQKDVIELAMNTAGTQVCVFANNLPVGRLMKDRACDSIVANWDSPVLVEAFLKAAKAGLQQRDINEFGYVSFPYTIKGPNHLRNVIRNAQATANIATKSTVDEARLIHRQALQTAAIASIKGVYPDLTNPIRDRLVAALEANGVREPRTLIDGIMTTAAIEWLQSIFKYSKSIEEKSSDRRDEITQMVAKASFQSGVTISEAASLAANLTSGNTGLAPALLPAVAKTDAPALSWNDKMKRSMSKFG